MQVRPTEIWNPNQPSDKAFGLKRTSKVMYQPNACKAVFEKVELQNGKTVNFIKQYNGFGKLTEKLAYLKDSAGEWVKSKLQCYKGREVVKILKGSKENGTVQ